MQNKIPIVWANGDSSGMLLDPIVGQLTSPAITDTRRNYFESAWNAGRSFKELFDGADPALRFSVPSCLQKDVCAPFEEHNVMGTTASGACAYWTASTLSLTYECLNDGTCASGVGGTRGKYYDKDTCDANCGEGKWQCMQNAQHPKCAGKHARTCVADNNGACKTLAECEKACYT